MGTESSGVGVPRIDGFRGMRKAHAPLWNQISSSSYSDGTC